MSSSSSSSNSHVPRDHELEILINDVKARIRKFYGGIKEQIERTGNFLKEKKLIKERDICIEIKSYLKEEIKDQIISERTIDRCCPDEWKHKTKPKKERHLSFFEDKNLQEQEIVTNTSAKLTCEGQILQDLELGDKSNKSNEQKPKEIKMNLSEGVVKDEDVQISRERESMELKRLKIENEQQRQEIELLRSELGKQEKQNQQRDVSSCSTVQGSNTKDPKDIAFGKVQSSNTSPKVPKEQNEQNLLDIDIFIIRDRWWEHFITTLASKSGDIIRAKFVFDKLTQIATITIE